jgi:hypothetical protein
LSLSLRCGLVAAIVLSALLPLEADSAPFDLAGPRIDVRVARKGRTLPIAETPNLQAGDRLWIHPDLPASQSARYLMVVVFLRGATNPPPDKWFTRAETWTRPVSEEGVFVTVPEGAQQALLLLAPETGGDFKTLRSAVRGRPGSFVRSTQDLDQASLDRSRLNAYLDSVRKASASDPVSLHDTSVLLTRSLNLKLKEDCFDQAAAEQEQCLTQDGDQLVLNDGHSQSVVSALTSSAAPDLVTQLSFTQTAGAGYYSPYVGAIVDLARLLDSMHTAQYQYIPALSLPQADSLDLKLNNPPSFHNPKSVIVVALPAVTPTQLPPLRAVDAKRVYCLAGKEAVLPAEGAPLVYSTSYAHGLELAVRDSSGKAVSLPVHADAAKGGFVVDASGVAAGRLPARLTGEITGEWGFSAWKGPTFSLATPHATSWKVAASDATALVVGRDDDLHLQGDAAICVSGVKVRDGSGKEETASFQAANPDEIAVKVPLAHAAPGPVTLVIQQQGLAKAEEVKLQSYAEAGHLDGFHLHAGDSLGYLFGTRLDEVAGLEVGGVHFAPGRLSRNGDKDALEMQAQAGQKQSPGALGAGAAVSAKVELKDGRTLELATTIEPPRPEVALLSKSVQPGDLGGGAEAGGAGAAGTLQLTDANELPLGNPISFVLKAVTPATFGRNEHIEIATADGSLHTTLTLADGSLLLQDSATVLGTFNPLNSFGRSAFGLLQLRPVDATGALGNWSPLGTLVRVPELKSLTCPAAAEGAAGGAGAGSRAGQETAKPGAAGESGTAQATAEAPPCTLSGTNLFLVDAIAADAHFARSVSVPDGFTGATLAVPRPSGDGRLYVRLRDDPGVTNTISFPAAVQAPARESARGKSGRGVAAASGRAVAPAPGQAVPAASGTAAPAPAGAAVPAPATPGTTAPAAPATQGTAAPAAPASQGTAAPNSSSPARPAASGSGAAGSGAAGAGAAGATPGGAGSAPRAATGPA